ncbi:MAG: ATP-dependent 6-phosphofructokinase, partial [Lentisphaerae bacterium]|nr:ATP-dependent 6-phosphofructokinase [Lentisphaerota bacterium]
MTIKDVFKNPEKYDFDVEQLGECVIDSPVKNTNFVSDGERTLVVHDLEDVTEAIQAGRVVPSFEEAGPRSKIFHDP